MSKKIKTLEDIQKDEYNLNVGTKRGDGMIYESLDKYKGGRSILVDKNGKLIAGDKTVEQAKALGMEIHVIESDGEALLVHQRTDLDMDSDKDTRARELAIVDNRTSEVSYYLDPEMLEKLKTEKNINFGVAFTEDEFNIFFKNTDDDEWGSATRSLTNEDKSPFQQITFTLHDEQVDEITRALKIAKGIADFSGMQNENSNGNALYFICQEFIRLKNVG